MGVLRYGPAMSEDNTLRLRDRAGATLRGSLRTVLLVSACLLFANCAAAQTEKLPAQIVITHVTVINPGTSSVRRDAMVVITGDRITAVSSETGSRPPKNARVV